ncbi:MAG: 30S ribosomal protein S2 [Candidatus Moranbacteria bacterium]|nr:30S ribosomal protein S2 [Candidatus Moranbacteria bacterium]PIP25243.1 MAG: 30S ribosomal protein S2 [Candidatus Moranbacteria bacterium CG23_combo_of_CG06-09_8_20_14_all_41_28]PIV86198.1 MAG: 30S ribosomal protein S2 [Candidatus Moranbacteria bacterium CG17_big_fil_post_rev_8_21_14_2_50_41_107]PIW94521.1 MAG: 30S ribosomal protein S2 [Candidatus Moranbacteria bacterium CG_4_8_14_3_um_filter_41_13]PIX91555.1 MAG: 30S ribosomal protein S2 [Candidatus Moranbacteria bacterium CG_4_10_14_3_um_f
MAEETTVVAEDVATKKASEEAVAEHFFASFDFGALQVNLEELLKAGVHFGHLKSRRHPKMDQYIYTTRKNINIVDLEKTYEKLHIAGKFLAEVVKSGKPILFVGMKKQTQDTVQSLALRLNESYVIDRWLGGTLTNFSCINSRAKYLNDTHDKIEQGAFKQYTKFEQAKKAEEVEKLERKVGGIKNMHQLPGAIVIADVKDAGLVIYEARKMNIPLVGITDTNTDPSFVDYPIPGNDDALSSLRLLFGYLGKVILEAKEKVATTKKEVVKTGKTA